MQAIEKALFTVIDEIGNGYTLPVGQTLNDYFNIAPSIKNPFFGQTPKKVKFMFGTQKELNIWISETKEKYPVVWLVYPISETSDLSPKEFYSYKNARLIFAIDNTIDKLVTTRLQTTRFVLDQIVQKFLSLMTHGKFRKYIFIDRNEKNKQSFEPNYSVTSQKESATIDVWDAIVLDCNIYFMPKCFK